MREVTRGSVLATHKALGLTRMGTLGYLCVLAYIRAEPASSYDVARDFSLTRQSARELLNRMGELGMAHTCDSVRYSDRGPRVPVWAYGPGEVRRVGIPCRETMPALIQLKHVLACFSEPLTLNQVAEQSGSGRRQIGEFLHVASSLQMIHVHHWEHPNNPQGGGQPVAYWVAGPGRSAPRPKARPVAEHQRRKNHNRRAREEMQRVLSALAGRKEPQTAEAA